MATFALIYSLWTLHYGYPHPMPQYGPIWHFLNWFLIYPLVFWTMFPSIAKRKDSIYRRKIFLCIVFMLLRQVFTLMYTSVPSSPMVKNKNWQWTLGIVFPLLKKITTWWNRKFTCWAFDADEERAMIENLIFIGAQHSQTITIVLSSTQIDQWITYILILTDSLMNFLSFRNIIRLHQQGTSAANVLRDRSLSCLALKEYLDFLIPSVFLLSFVGSYIGPNYGLIGGIGSDMWHHEKTTNLVKKSRNILIFMSIEMLRGIGFAVALKHLYGLSLYSGYCYIIRKFGWFILFLVAITNQLVNGHYL